LFAGVNDTADKLLTGVNDTADKFFTDDKLDNRGLFFLQIGTNRRYLRPPKSDGVIGTAMKSCIHRHSAYLDKRPPKLLQLLEY
jgi:hypothetical protein